MPLLSLVGTMSLRGGRFSDEAIHVFLGIASGDIPRNDELLISLAHQILRDLHGADRIF